jgi:deoxycytidylate deaminase
MHPCNLCAQAIVQNRIQKVIYLDNPYAEEDSVKAASMIFAPADIAIAKYKPEGPSGLHRVQEKLKRL